MGASGNQGEDYTIDQSCRFDGSSSYLSRTPASASNRILWTQSVWVKRCYLDAFGGAAAIRYQFLLNTNNSPNDGSYFYASDTFEWLHSGSQLRETDQSLRDVAAWYHLVWTFDSNQASEPNRSKLWINGAEVTDYNKEADIDEDETMEINNTILHAIGRNEWDDNNYFNGYMADYILIDGAALTADSFGETNSTTGQWVPIDPSGLTFGTNGFWLDFSDSSALGTDVSRVTTSTAMTSSMWGRDTGDFTFSGDDIASSASDKVIWGPSFSGDFEVTMDVVAQGSFIPGFVILADDMSSNYLTSSGRTAWYWKGDGTDPGIYSNNGGTTVRRQATSDDDLDGVTLKITRTSGTFKWYKDGSLYFTDTSVTHTGPVKFVIQTTGGGNTVISHFMAGLTVGKLYRFSAYVKQGTQAGAGNNGSFQFRNEEDQTSVSYFCRVRSGQNNFSINPTFVSGSQNELRQKSMKGNPNVYITGVELYNGSGEVVATGKLSKPLKKNFSSEATIKVKLTF